jgi:HlyD family secretion protein
VVNTHVGEVIQGGKTTITGGTVLALVAEVDKIYVKTEVDEADIGVVRELAPEFARPQLAARSASDGGPSDAGPSGAEPAPGGDESDEVPIATGSKVKITVEAFRDEDFHGVIERIYPEPKKASAVVTYIVDVLITSSNREKLMLGMHADVEFTAKSVHNAVLVSRDAIKRGPNGKDLGVYIPTVGPNGKPGDPKFVKCRFGLDNGLFAEVIEGLKEGDVVYTQVPGKTEREEEKAGSK